jgi:eukaryotic-like serine/threonine-protein kinase
MDGSLFPILSIFAASVPTKRSPMQRSRIGPFALEEALDDEGCGNVLRGLHLERKTSMAVKLLPASLVNRPMAGNAFMADVKRLQRLVHPNIIRYLGGAVEDGQPYLALELVQGESLRDLLDRRGKLPWEMAVDLVDEICLALKHAHQAGFVHQRLTPARILLPQGGGVKLCGFDCVWCDKDEVLGLRVPMSVAHYLAPEEFRGKQSASLPPCDLFSVGVILYECLSGELPWKADTPADLVHARRSGDAPRVSSQVLDCPVWLDVLTSKLLAVKRAERLSSADEAHRAIVNAKDKVASGMSATQQALSGRKGMFKVNSDRAEIVRLKKHMQTKERDTSPFYERVWFLAFCLAVLAAGGWWSLQPASEETLIARLKPLMESDNTVDWKEAEGLIDKLREHYPETTFTDEVAEFEQKRMMYQAETRARNNERLGRPADSEAERLFTEAWEYEKMGDRMTAWQKYEALISLFNRSDDEYDRAYVGLARRRIGSIKSDPGGGESQLDFVRDQINKAKRLQGSGDLVEARRILDSVVALYDGNQELQPLVDQARSLMQSLSGRN